MSRTDQIAPKGRPETSVQGNETDARPFHARRTRTAVLGGGVVLALVFTAISLLAARDELPPVSPPRADAGLATTPAGSPETSRSISQTSRVRTAPAASGQVSSRYLQRADMATTRPSRQAGAAKPALR
ncbi:MAG: hypothetical protein WBA65_10645, partial [Rhodanobacter sp.]